MRGAEDRTASVVRWRRYATGGYKRSERRAAVSSYMERLAGKRLRQQEEYRITCLCGMAASLLIVGLVFHVPPGAGPPDDWQKVPAVTIIPPEYIEFLPGMDDDRPEDQLPIEEIQPDVETLERREVANRPASGQEAPEPGLSVGSQGNDVAALRPHALATFRVAKVQAASVYLAQMPEYPQTDKLDHPPKLDSETMEIKYPSDARRRGVEGLVVLYFLVDSEGQASGIQIVTSVSPSCDAAAVEAVRRARFMPGRQAGQAKAAFTRLGIRFVLN